MSPAKGEQIYTIGLKARSALVSFSIEERAPKERELGLFFGNAIMSKCSEVWVFGSHISPGMDAEIKRAKWKNYRLRYFTENLEEV